MIIEFFGFPGSGKTTISNAFIKELEENDIGVVRGTFDHLSKIKRVFWKTLFSGLSIFYNTEFFIRSILFFIKNRSLSDFLNITYLYSRYSYCKNTNKIVIFDQGLTQAYLSIYSFTKRGKGYDSFFLFKKIDRLILLQLNFDENIKRLSTRKGKSSRAQKNKANIQELWKSYKKIENQIISQLNSNQILEIDSEKLTEENIERLMEWMLDF